jgi:hypothetical protein
VPKNIGVSAKGTNPRIIKLSWRGTKQSEMASYLAIEIALDRLVKLYPQLKKESEDIHYIITKRNYLMHNFGYINILELEKKIQTKIADMSEAICKECLNENPEDVFTKEVWVNMSDIRDAYKQDDYLEIKKKLSIFKDYGKKEKFYLVKN